MARTVVRTISSAICLKKGISCQPILIWIKPAGRTGELADYGLSDQLEFQAADLSAFNKVCLTVNP